MRESKLVNKKYYFEPMLHFSLAFKFTVIYQRGFHYGEEESLRYDFNGLGNVYEFAFHNAFLLTLSLPLVNGSAPSC